MRQSLRSMVSAGLMAMAPFVAAQAQEPIRIGIINPFSGPLAQYGDEVTRGYELAADDANAKGGINGRKIEMLRGDASNPQQGIAVVEQMISRDKVDAFMGTYVSAISNAASDAALRYSKIYWETHALAADLTERGLPNFFRVGPNAGAFADVSVTAVKMLLAPKFDKPLSQIRVWIEHEDSAYGTSIAQAQKRLFEAAGIGVAGVGAHSFKSIDLTDSILRAKNTNPDVWISTAYIPDQTLLLRTMRDQAFKPGGVILLGTGDSAEFKDFGDFLNGVLVVGYPHSDLADSFAPGAGAFVAAYKAKHNREPIAPQSLEAFTGAKMLFDMIAEAGGTDMEKFRTIAAKANKPIRSYPNGFGLKFDGKMQNQLAIPNITQWQSTKTVTVYPQEATLPGVVLINVPRK